MTLAIPSLKRRVVGLGFVSRSAIRLSFVLSTWTACLDWIIRLG